MLFVDKRGGFILGFWQKGIVIPIFNNIIPFFFLFVNSNSLFLLLKKQFFCLSRRKGTLFGGRVLILHR